MLSSVSGQENEATGPEPWDLSFPLRSKRFLRILRKQGPRVVGDPRPNWGTQRAVGRDTLGKEMLPARVPRVQEDPQAWALARALKVSSAFSKVMVPDGTGSGMAFLSHLPCLRREEVTVGLLSGPAGNCGGCWSSQATQQPSGRTGPLVPVGRLVHRPHPLPSPPLGAADSRLASPVLLAVHGGHGPFL